MTLKFAFYPGSYSDYWIVTMVCFNEQIYLNALNLNRNLYVYVFNLCI